MWSVLALLAGPAAADPSEEALREYISAIEELSLAELLLAESDIATRTVEEIREAPGIVTVLDADDIARAGCDDLLDVLLLVPEFAAGSDLWNQVGLGVRGNWAAEGKVLVLLDGHVWNEQMFGTVTLGNRLPAFLIERVEVIRGPASAVYGGLASLAVVKVTTRATSDTEGVHVDALATWFDSGTYASQDLGISAASDLGDDARIGVSAVLGRGHRSDGTWRSVYGGEVDLSTANAIDPALVSAELRVDGLTVAGALERYHTTFRDGVIVRQAIARDANFLGAWARASWELPLGERVTLIPRASFTWQRPYESTRFIATSSLGYSREEVDRTLVGADLSAQPVDALDLLAGAELGLDRGHEPEFQPFRWFDNGTPDRSWAFGAVWLQGVWKTRWVNAVASLRAEEHQSYGEAWSPRVGLTRAYERGHWKLLLGRAHHAPSVAAARSGVEAEVSTTVEAEVGVQPLDPLYLKLSAFDVRIHNPLVYYVATEPEPFEGYINGARAGTAGGTFDATFRAGSVAVDAGYAVYTAAGIAETDQYEVPGHPGARLALPTHKGVIRGSVTPIDPLTVGLVATALGSRWAITSVVGDAPAYEALPAAVVFDANAAVRVGLLRVAVTAHDLLDAAPAIAQPYDGWHAPLPAGGREIGVRVTVGR